jgi:hypothetical protein
MNPTEQKALDVLAQQLGDAQTARNLLTALHQQGLWLADERRNELVCRWVNVLERPVPPEADTIIRTITRTVDSTSTSSTHWLDGLRNPRE